MKPGIKVEYSKMEKIIENNKDIRETVKEYKSTAKCEICGESHPACIVIFDRKKKRSISVKLLNRVRACQPSKTLTKTHLYGVLNKYSAICENCQRKKYPTRGNLPPHLQREIDSIKRKRGCVECEERNQKCLDFHHRDSEEKEFTIGSGNVLNREAILMEIEKCDVICRNCHSKLHWEEENNLED